VAGGRQGRPTRPSQAVHTPRLAVHGRSAAQAGSVIREGQAHQQRDGQARTREYCSSVIITTIIIITGNDIIKMSMSE